MGETVDPIAELLSQLSGVRRAAGSSSSQLHQLQLELQLQRQQAQAQRQTLDRLARSPPATSAPAQAQPSSATPATSSSSSNVKPAETSTPPSSNFLLDELIEEDGME